MPMPSVSTPVTAKRQPQAEAGGQRRLFRQHRRLNMLRTIRK